MMKSLGKLTLATILAALVVGVPLGASAQDKTAPAPAPATPAKARAHTFRTSKIAAVDKAALTISLDDKGKHVLQVNKESKIYIDKKPATLDDVMVGQMATGSFTPTSDGKFNLKTLNIHTAASAPAPK